MTRLQPDNSEEGNPSEAASLEMSAPYAGRPRTDRPVRRGLPRSTGLGVLGALVAVAALVVVVSRTSPPTAPSALSVSPSVTAAPTDSAAQVEASIAALKAKAESVRAHVIATFAAKVDGATSVVVGEMTQDGEPIDSPARSVATVVTFQDGSGPAWVSIEVRGPGLTASYVGPATACNNPVYSSCLVSENADRAGFLLSTAQDVGDAGHATRTVTDFRGKQDVVVSVTAYTYDPTQPQSTAAPPRPIRVTALELGRIATDPALTLA